MQFKRAIFIAVCIKLGTFSMVNGQKPRKVGDDRLFNVARFAPNKISIEAAEQPPVPLKQFSAIEVVDIRPDTLALGFRKLNAQRIGRMYRFGTNMTNELKKYIIKNTSTDNDANAPALVLFVKDCWLREFDADEEVDDKTRTTDGAEITFNKTSFTFQADCFVRKGGDYYAIKRFDTTISKLLDMMQFSKTYFDFTLTIFFNQVERLDVTSAAAGKTKRSFDEIVAYYHSRWQMPILTDSILQKGVYQTFEEFKMNNPSIREFELKKDKLADILYIGGNTKQAAPTRNAWGYCDGKYVFIKSGENYYPMVRYQNSFYFLGSSRIFHEHYQGVGPVGASGMYGYDFETTTNPLYPFKLNWQSGKAY